jgi:hypothetical protein
MFWAEGKSTERNLLTKSFIACCVRVTKSHSVLAITEVATSSLSQSRPNDDANLVTSGCISNRTQQRGGEI